jgi:hypothetical protein
MEDFISNITKLFLIKNCCCYENVNKKNIIVKEKNSKWNNYKGLNGLYLHSEEKKIYDEIQNKMEFRRGIVPKTPRKAVD